MRVLSIKDNIIDIEEVESKDFPQLVDGLFDIIEITDYIDLYVNDEFLLRGDFRPTLRLPNCIVFGPCFFVGHDGNGNNIGLTNMQIRYIIERFL